MKTKQLFLTAIFILTAAAGRAQILDGTIQAQKFGCTVPCSFNLKNDKYNLYPQFTYRQDIVSWFNASLTAQYSTLNKAFSTELAVEFNLKKRYFLLTRGTYDYCHNSYVHDTAATVYLPKGFTMDATWGGMFRKEKGRHTDRLQFLAGYTCPKFTVNAGVSVLYKAGFVANFKFWPVKNIALKAKYDSGVNRMYLGVTFRINTFKEI